MEPVAVSPDGLLEANSTIGRGSKQRENQTHIQLLLYLFLIITGFMLIWNTMSAQSEKTKVDHQLMNLTLRTWGVFTFNFKLPWIVSIYSS